MAGLPHGPAAKWRRAGRRRSRTSRGCIWRTRWCSTSPSERRRRPAPPQGCGAAARACGRRGGRAPTSTCWSAPETSTGSSRALARAAAGSRYSQLETGSAFEHAANWWHPRLGVRRPARPLAGGDGRAPRRRSRALGEESFDQRDRPRPVPGPRPDAQLLVLLLHAARRQEPVDVEYAWHAQPDEQRGRGHRPGRPAGRRGGAGRGDRRPRGTTGATRSYALWHYYSEGGGRLDEWRARYRAADSSAARLRLVGSAARVNRDHLALQLGHVPSRAEVRRAQLARIVKLGREAVRALSPRSGRRAGDRPLATSLPARSRGWMRRTIGQEGANIYVAAAGTRRRSSWRARPGRSGRRWPTAAPWTRSPGGRRSGPGTTPQRSVATSRPSWSP